MRVSSSKAAAAQPQCESVTAIQEVSEFGLLAIGRECPSLVFEVGAQRVWPSLVSSGLLGRSRLSCCVRIVLCAMSKTLKPAVLCMVNERIYHSRRGQSVSGWTPHP